MLKKKIDEISSDNAEMLRPIDAYLFCQEITPDCKKKFEYSDKENIVFHVLAAKDILNLVKERKKEESIDLKFKLTYANSDVDENNNERVPYLCNLFQGDRYEELEDIYVALVGISGTGFIEALKTKFGENLENVKNVFSDNVRGFIGNIGENKGIYETIEKHPERFALRNNGICLTASYYAIDKPNINNAAYTLTVKGAQIINGAQTIGTIICFYIKNKNNLELIKNLDRVRIPVKIISRGNTNKYKSSIWSGREDLKDEIIKYHNTQSIVESSDFHSKDPLQENIKSSLKNYAINYHIRRSEDPRYRLKCTKIRKKGSTNSFIIKPHELFKVLIWTNVNNHIDNELGLTRIAFATEKEMWSKSYYPKYFRENNTSERWSGDFTKKVSFYCFAYRKIDPKLLVPTFVDMRTHLKPLLLKLYSLFYERASVGDHKYDKSDLDNDKTGINLWSTLLKPFFNTLKNDFDMAIEHKTLASYLKYRFTQKNIPNKLTEALDSYLSNIDFMLKRGG